MLRVTMLMVALSHVLAAAAPHPVSFSSANSAEPHFHATGDKLELGHDETACPVYTVQQTAFAHTQPVRLPTSHVGFASSVLEAHQALATSPSFQQYSRGPPLG